MCQRWAFGHVLTLLCLYFPIHNTGIGSMCMTTCRLLGQRQMHLASLRQSALFSFLVALSIKEAQSFLLSGQSETRTLSFQP